MNRVLVNTTKKVITDVLDSLSGNEMKLLLIMARYSDDNVVDMSINERKILSACGISYKTFTKQRSVLAQKKILVITEVSKVYFIDPSFLLAGYAPHIYKTAAALEAKYKHWREEANDRKQHRDRAIESSIGDESLKKYFDDKRVSQNNMSLDEVYETIEKEDIGDVDSAFIGSRER
jgi:stalled ribosome rescue protein Dom34